MKKFKLVASLTLVSAMLISMVGCTKSTSEVSSVSSLEGSSVETVSVKEDFYNAINGEWLSDTVISASSPMVGSLSEMSDKVDEVLKDDFAQMLAGTKEPGTKEIANFIEFYRLATNFEQREADGTAPIQPIIDEIESISSLEDFSNASNWVEWNKNLNYSSFTISVAPDMLDANTNVIYFTSPGLFLNNKEYYEDEAMKESLQSVWSESKQKVLVLAGKTPEEAATIAQQALAFDESLVPYTKSAVEKADVAGLYNPISVTELDETVQSFDFTSILTEIFGVTPETVVLDNPAYFEAFDTVLNQDTFEQFKSWVLIQSISAYAGMLTDEIRIADGAFGRALLGITEASTKEESAYAEVLQYFDQPVGVYYGKTYFGEEAKQDVTNMVNDIVSVYKERLTNNTWLSGETKEKAIEKLDNMILNIGYPETVPEVYDEITITPESENGQLVENAINVVRALREDNYKKWNQPVDKMAWPLSAATVNAMYSFTSNSINMTAAILQAPIYSLEQSSSANYGAAGAVIAHEISHAFDTNGAQYDKNGSLNDWWTEEDYVKFSSLAQEMIDEFNGVETEYGTINGELTVTENIADAGGLSCALDAAKGSGDLNLEDFFKGWAVMWRQKATPEYEALIITSDVHAPNKERVNIQLQNLDDFYATYDIQEGDTMYRAPEARVSIW